MTNDTVSSPPAHTKSEYFRKALPSAPRAHSKGFLDLPGEIRTPIYHYLFNDVSVSWRKRWSLGPPPVSSLESSSWSLSPQLPRVAVDKVSDPIVSILLTCRTCRSEAITTFYQSAIFVIRAPIYTKATSRIATDDTTTTATTTPISTTGASADLDDEEKSDRPDSAAAATSTINDKTVLATYRPFVRKIRYILSENGSGLLDGPNPYTLFPNLSRLEYVLRPSFIPLDSTNFTRAVKEIRRTPQDLNILRHAFTHSVKMHHNDRLHDNDENARRYHELRQINRWLDDDDDNVDDNDGNKRKRKFQVHLRWRLEYRFLEFETELDIDDWMLRVWDPTGTCTHVFEIDQSQATKPWFREAFSDDVYRAPFWFFS